MSTSTRKPGLSLRKAINDHCKQCIYDQYSKGTWRQQVEACTSPGCALYSVRPISYTEKVRNHSEKAVFSS